MNTSTQQRLRRWRRSVWALSFAALAALLLAGINEAAYRRSTAALTSLTERDQARTQIQLVWRALVDAEAGQRGYLLTGGPAYLQPYLEAEATVQEALNGLRSYYGGDAQAQPVLAALTEHSLGKLSELATTLQLHARPGSQAWHDLMLTDIGRERMEGLRTASQLLMQLETQRVAVERGDIVTTLRNSRLGVGALTVMSLLALFLFLRRTRVLDRAQAGHAAALQAERDRLQDEVARRTADLTELARHLQNAREDMKSHLARELHDELGALLTAAKLDAARLKRAIGPPTPDIEERLAHLNGSINRGIELKRRIIEELRPSSLSNLGLVAALEILVREFGARSDVCVRADLQAGPPGAEARDMQGEVPANLQRDVQTVALSDAAQITVYRLVQEALNNAAQHAAATLITVTLQPAARPGGGPEGACISVRDNGSGFNTTQQRGTTHGLMGLRYRVEAEGGVMQVQATPGAGTLVQAWLPRAPVAVG